MTTQALDTLEFAKAVARLSAQRNGLTDDASEWQYVKFDIDVPSSYWREGSEALPSATAQRVARLDAYDDLFHGDWSEWLLPSERIVTKNWFGDVGQMYADFMLSSPPVWYVGDIELKGSGLIADSALNSFERAVELIVRDQVTYGVGLVEVYGGEVLRVLPRLWFPTGGEGDVVAGPVSGESGSFVVKRFESGGVILREYFGLDDAGKLSSYGGEMLPTVEHIGQAAAWDVIMDMTDGRAVPLTPCPREPAEGEWGWRLFEDLAKLVFDYNRRVSRRSISITRHDDPILAAIPDDQAPVMTAPRFDGNQTEQEQVRIEQLNTELAQWRSQHVAFMPRGIRALEYISYTGDYQATTEALDTDLKDIISTARLPASLLGVEDTTTLASGVALRIAHSQTYLTIQNIQESLVAQLKRIMLILALSEGASAETLRTFADNLRVEWMNPIDYLEEGVSMMTEEGSNEGAVDDKGMAMDVAMVAAALQRSAVPADG